jgi:hypothetical protein
LIREAACSLSATIAAFGDVLTMFAPECDAKIESVVPIYLIFWQQA